MAKTTAKRTWSGLLLYTLCSFVWVYAYQVVFVGVLCVGILVGLCTCKVQNLLSGVSRAVWQVELWVYQLYVTDSTLRVPRVEAITLGTVWWTFVYFFLTKAWLTAYFTAIVSTIFNDYKAYQVAATAAQTPTLFSLDALPQTPPPASDASGETMAELVFDVLAWFSINILMVWFATWWTNKYYTWMVSELERKTEARHLPHFQHYRLGNAADATSPFRPFMPPSPPPVIPFSSQGCNGSVTVMGAPPLHPPQLEQNTSSQSSVSSAGTVASAANVSFSNYVPHSMPPSMTFQRSMQSHAAQTGVARPAQPLLHFSSTLTERHGVLGFPVPPPPLRSTTSSGALHTGPGSTEHNGETQHQANGGMNEKRKPPPPPQPPMAPHPPNALQSPPLSQPAHPAVPTHFKRKKADALLAKHEHKLDSMADRARHQLHSLHRILATVKSHPNTNMIMHARRRLATLEEMVAHAPLLPDERLQFDLSCREVAQILEESTIAASTPPARDSTREVFDHLVDDALGHVRHLQEFWTMQRPQDHDTVSELRRQLDDVLMSIASVPATWPRRNELEDQHRALDAELAAWLSNQDNEKNAVRNQLDSIHQTLVQDAGLSNENKVQLQRMCCDLQDKLAAMERGPSSTQATVSHAFVPQLPSATSPHGRTPAAPAPEAGLAQTLVDRYATFGGPRRASAGPASRQQPATPGTFVVHQEVEVKEMSDVDVSETEDYSRKVQVTEAARSGWQSPCGYDHPGSPDYGVMSPSSGTTTSMPSFATSSPAYGQLSPTGTSSMLSTTGPSATFEAAPTFRSASLSPSDVYDPVHFMSFAPPSVCRGMVFQFNIWAFLVHQRDEAAEEALAADLTARQLSRELLLRVRRGALAHITLQVPSGFCLDHCDSTQVLSWTGNVTSVKYGVECTPSAPLGQVLFKATIVVGTDVMILRSFVCVAAMHTRRDAAACELDSMLEVLPKSFTEIPFDTLSIRELIGRGHFGDAYRAEYQGKQVVVKTIRASVLGGDSADQVVDEFRHEAAVLNMFGHHPHIVPFVGACTDPSSTLSLVTEYLPYGTIEDQYRRHLTAAQKTRIVADAAAGLANMHEGGFIHRDIAARNCLVDGDLRAKVCDFGLCRRVEACRAGVHFENGVGPLRYMAPESLQPPHVFSTKSDAFAFGVLVWETFTETKPFATRTAHEAAAFVLEGGRLDHMDAAIPVALQRLMAQCFQEDPMRRPTMTDIAAACRHADLSQVD
ncbi:serine/threonine protein kinase [Aphanomyces invadans]|uniref:Serine/threonine protein kinase n=1 Tax=Aphanomyces invadans TaxID=157072 RepID=A0A024UCU9_9STRA|nr:serine/threonine protein kinase [Aphanomyces invadans]ETW03717.1 serine/threonine protein kinase [Aphanomyces invadans]|eukprot:XP_008867946.1 serine/threonine protein kinase [Aphanomyces invadans]